MIAESHIKIVTFPQIGRSLVDVFSCKAFNQDLIVDAVQEAFNPEMIQGWIIDRTFGNSSLPGQRFLITTAKVKPGP